MEKHYAHRCPSIQYAFGLFEDSINTGVVTYGQPPSPFCQEGICGKPFMSLVIELNRLCVDSKTKNASSFLVGNSLKLIPKPRIVISFADTSVGHVGYIYQATNWIYTGLSEIKMDYGVKGMEGNHARHALRNYGTVARAKEALGDKLIQVERAPKHRYLQFLGDKKWKKETMRHLRYKALPYPKGDTKRYDASAPIPTQSVLF